MSMQITLLYSLWVFFAINFIYLLLSVREIRKHHQEDVEKDQESSRWKKIWRAIARKAKRKKN